MNICPESFDCTIHTNNQTNTTPHHGPHFRTNVRTACDAATHHTAAQQLHTTHHIAHYDTQNVTIDPSEPSTIHPSPYDIAHHTAHRITTIAPHYYTTPHHNKSHRAALDKSTSVMDHQHTTYTTPHTHTKCRQATHHAAPCRDSPRE